MMINRCSQTLQRTQSLKQMKTGIFINTISKPLNITRTPTHDPLTTPLQPLRIHILTGLEIRIPLDALHDQVFT